MEEMLNKQPKMVEKLSKINFVFWLLACFFLLCKFTIPKESDRLFIRREGDEMFGKKKFNFLVLWGILFLTLLGVSFSYGGLEFLRFKMEDPFINWVDIVRQGRFDRLKNDLDQASLKSQYKYSSYEKNTSLLYYFRPNSSNINQGKTKDHIFEGRTIDPNSTLLDKIFAKENTITRRGNLHKNDYGVIITQEMANLLAVEDRNKPTYINLVFPLDKKSATALGYISESGDNFYSIPIPVIAIVKQLPGLMSFMAAPYFYSQLTANNVPFDLTKPEYNNHLEYFIPNRSKQLDDKVKQEIKNQLSNLLPQFQDEAALESWEKGKRLSVYFGQKDTLKMNTFSYELLNKFGASGLRRTFSYTFYENENSNLNPDYLSIHFTSLDSIRPFQQHLKDEYQVKIDMSQIDSKDNFNFVNKMGIALSAGFVTLACIFVFTFIFYLLRTHFLKIKRNLGTFKAFGVSNKELTLIYTTIMLKLTTIALVFAYCATYLIEIILDYRNIKIQDDFSYLDTVSLYGLGVLFLTLVTALLATKLVVSYMLRATPGDLIYDRDF